MEPKILVVDDEAHIRLLIEQTLEELEDQGVEILTADNGVDRFLVQVFRIFLYQERLPS